MIGSHPGGVFLTNRLLELAGLKPPGRILDLGAGQGESLRHLRKLGYEAVGIDKAPSSGRGWGGFLQEGLEEEEVFFGDMRSLPFSDQSFDVCLAECSLSGCGNGPKALKEAYRVLRPGGSLLISDVFFKKENAPALSMPEPLRFSCWTGLWRDAGFQVKAFLDETPLWREFYLESLWNGNADPVFLDFFREAGKAGCGYFLAWLEKGVEDGII